jgi:hypothetical protein
MMKYLKLISVSIAILLAAIGASQSTAAAMPLSGPTPSAPTAVCPGNGALISQTYSNLPAGCQPSTATTFTIKWTDTAPVSGDYYDIEIATQPTFGGYIVDGSDSGGTTVCNIGVSGPGTGNFFVAGSSYTYLPATTYFWRVRAYGQLSDCTTPTYVSPWSTTFSFRTKIAAPTPVSPLGGPTPLLDNKNNDVTHWPPSDLFQWTGVTGASGYQLQVSHSTLFNSFVLNVTLPYTATSYSPATDLPANQTLYWRVETLNTGFGPSDWTTPIQFITANPATVPVLAQPATGKLDTDHTPGLAWLASSLPGGTTFTSYEVQVWNNSTFKDSTDYMCFDVDYTTDTVDLNTGDINHTQMDVANAGLSMPGPTHCPFYQSPVEEGNATNLPDATTLYWRVRTENTDGTYTFWSDWSAPFNFISSVPKVDIITTPPTPACATTLTDAGGGNRPLFTWTAVDKATNYNIQISRDPLVNSPFVVNLSSVGTSFTPPTPLPRATTLYWHVRGNNNLYGPGDWSDICSFTTEDPPGAPTLVSPPYNKLLTDQTGTYTPTLTWSISSAPVAATFGYYELEIATTSAFGASDVGGPGVTDTSSTNQYSPTIVSPWTLAPATKYYWHVRACNTVPECSVWSPTGTFRISVDQVSSIGPSGSGTSFPVTFTWTAVPGATGYQLNISTTHTFSTTYIAISGGGTTSVMRNLPPHVYYWRIRATSSLFGPGAWSVVLSFSP